jgi:hypothetical protein
MFSELPTDIQLELLSFACPPDWPEFLAQFVEAAEEEFKFCLLWGPSRLDVWGSCKLHDAEIRGPANWINGDYPYAPWTIHSTVVVERETYGDGFTYKLGVYSEKAWDATGDEEEQQDDFAHASNVTRTWCDKDTFLKEASNLLEFCPRQIKRLPKLSCSLGLLRFDNHMHTVNLRQHGRGFWYLHHFSDNAGASSLLRRLQSGNQ